ncbi:MAG: hypothetical protein ACKPJD_21410, partial [Planctomycetaceae bacterium]
QKVEPVSIKDFCIITRVCQAALTRVYQKVRFLSAIVLLYRQVLELDPGLLDGVLATQRKPPAAAIVVDRQFPFNRSQPAPPIREFHIPLSSVAL